MAKKKKEEMDEVVVTAKDLDTMFGETRDAIIRGTDDTKEKIRLKLDRFEVDDIEHLENVVSHLDGIIEDLEEERDIAEDDEDEEDLDDDEDEDDDEEPEEEEEDEA